MTLPKHFHQCTECEGITIHHIHSHEEPGDEVTAWCKVCGADRQMVIRNHFA